MSQPQNTKVLPGYILSFEAPLGTPMASIVVTDQKNVKIINEFVNLMPTLPTPGTPPPAAGALVNYRIDLNTIRTQRNRSIKPTKKYTYKVALASAVNTTLGAAVEADASAVEPQEGGSESRSQIVKAVIVIALIALAFFFGRWTPSHAIERAAGSAATNSSPETRFKQLEEKMENFMKAAAKNAEAPVNAPTPMPVTASTSDSNKISSATTPSVHIVGNTAPALNMVNSALTVNGNLNIGANAGSKVKHSYRTWPYGANPKAMCDPLANEDPQHPSAPCIRLQVVIPPNGDCACVYRKGWKISYEGDFSGTDCGFQIKEDGSLIWAYANEVGAMTGNVEAIWFHNLTFEVRTGWMICTPM
jgi:hypothetical protein